MVSAINSALSGFAAATQRLNVSANNIANQFSTTQTDKNGNTINSPYVPQEVQQSSQVNGGVTTSVRNTSPASVSAYDPTNPSADAKGLVQYPNVDTAQQLVQTQIASYDAKGNLAVIKAQEKLFQSVLNIVS